jgi:hypothetical protein
VAGAALAIRAVHAVADVDTRFMKLGRAFWVLLVVGGTLPTVGNGCSSNGKASAPDAVADATMPAGGTANGGASGLGGGASGGARADGGGTASGGATTPGAGGGAGGSGGSGGSGGTGGSGGDGGTLGVGGRGGAGGAFDGGGGVDASADGVRRFACGGEECVVGESYCRSSGGGAGGAPRGAGIDGGGA